LPYLSKISYNGSNQVNFCCTTSNYLEEDLDEYNECNEYD